MRARAWLSSNGDTPDRLSGRPAPASSYLDEPAAQTPQLLDPPNYDSSVTRHGHSSCAITTNSDGQAGSALASARQHQQQQKPASLAKYDRQPLVPARNTALRRTAPLAQGYLARVAAPVTRVKNWHAVPVLGGSAQSIEKQPVAEKSAAKPTALAVPMRSRSIEPVDCAESTEATISARTFKRKKPSSKKRLAHDVASSVGEYEAAGVPLTNKTLTPSRMNRVGLNKLLGITFSRTFRSYGIYRGTIVETIRDTDSVKVLYNDGDSEIMTREQVLSHLSRQRLIPTDEPGQCKRSSNGTGSERGVVNEESSEPRPKRQRRAPRGLLAELEAAQNSLWPNSFLGSAMTAQECSRVSLERKTDVEVPVLTGEMTTPQSKRRIKSSATAAISSPTNPTKTGTVIVTDTTTPYTQSEPVVAKNSRGRRKDALSVASASAESVEAEASELQLELQRRLLAEQRADVAERRLAKLEARFKTACDLAALLAKTVSVTALLGGYEAASADHAAAYDE